MQDLKMYSSIFVIKQESVVVSKIGYENILKEATVDAYVVDGWVMRQLMSCIVEKQHNYKLTLEPIPS